jgi:hypothetical protein
MSETLGLNHNASTNAANLPAGFLGVDTDRLEASAGWQRSMAELRVGLTHLNEKNIGVAGSVKSACSHEDSNTLRHVTRGAALTEILLVDSLLDFEQNSGEYVNNLVTETQANPKRDLFRRVRSDLIEARRNAVLSVTRGLDAGETAQNWSTYDSLVDEVLTSAGLGESFEIAVDNLTGNGLDESTHLPDAKYGAALVALGVGIVVG